MKPTLVRIPFSHYCHKVEWAFTHAGIEYDTLDVGLAKMGRMARTTHTGTVPALLVGNRLIQESHGIMGWLAEEVPELDWYPDGALEWEVRMDNELGPVARREAYRVAYANPFGFNVPWAQRLLLRVVRKVLLNVMKHYKMRRFEDQDKIDAQRLIWEIATQLGDKKYLFGASPSAADFATAGLARPLLYIADAKGYAGEDWDKVANYIIRMKPEHLAIGTKRKIGEKDWKRLEELSKS